MAGPRPALGDRAGRRIRGAQHTDPAGHSPAISAPVAAARGRHDDRRLALVGARTSMPTGGRSCSPAAASWRRCAAGFAAQGFVEVETAILQVSPGNEAHLHAFATELDRPGRRARRRLYLHTSPEFACKKLLAAGERADLRLRPRVPQPRARARCTTRNSPCSNGTAPSEPYEALMADCAATARARRREPPGTHALRLPRPRPPIPFAAPERHDRRRGLRPPCRHRSRSPRVTADAADRDALAARPRAAGIRVAADDTWSRHLQPRPGRDRSSRNLGIGRPTHALTEYPSIEAALARREAGRSARRRALRALCLRRRARQRLRRTDRRGRAAPPLRGRDGRRSSASTASAIRSTRISSPRSPTCRRRAACALGFDRLVMLATGASRIDQVHVDAGRRAWSMTDERHGRSSDRSRIRHARGGGTQDNDAGARAARILARGPETSSTLARPLTSPPRACPAERAPRSSGRGALCGGDHAGDGRADRSATIPHDPIARQFVPDAGRAR